MPRRFLLLALSLLVALVCVRLGFWQLDRLKQRRRANADALAHLSLPPVELSRPGMSATPERFRRVRVAGRFDYAREIALTARGLNGSPGIHLVTPLVRDGTDTLVLILRGWVYSPDAATVDFARWREADSGVVQGFALTFGPDSARNDSSTLAPRAVRRLDHALLERRFGAPVAGYYIVMSGGDTTRDSVPVRVAAPALDEGPHFSYAVQWFLFAAIFGAGGTVVVLNARRPSPSEKVI